MNTAWTCWDRCSTGSGECWVRGALADTCTGAGAASWPAAPAADLCFLCSAAFSRGSPHLTAVHLLCRGRLFNQIRSRDGLAYSVSGGWAPTPTDHPGLFMATAETAQPAALLAALRTALEGAATAPPTAEELQRAKQVGGRCRRRFGMVLSAGQCFCLSTNWQCWQCSARPAGSAASGPRLLGRPLLLGPLFAAAAAGGAQPLRLQLCLTPGPAQPRHQLRPAGDPARLLVQACACWLQCGCSRWRRSCCICAACRFSILLLQSPQSSSSCWPRLPCRYREGIERVQPADVLAAAQRRLHPAQQTIVVAGDAASLRPQLEKALGLPVEDLPLT